MDLGVQPGGEHVLTILADILFSFIWFTGSGR